MTTVDVVVVNWNGAEVVGDCLRSVVSHRSEHDVRIVLVDNDSHDDSLAVARSAAPEASIVRTGSNLGFAGGVQAGIEASDGDVVVLLNNDATLESGFVDAAVARLLGSPSLGAVTGRLLLLEPRADGVRLVNSTGVEITASGNGRDRDWLRPEDEGSDSPREVFGLCGGAAALRRTALDDVGGFDPTLFLYYEDTDLSWRLRLAGWEIEYERGATVLHRHAHSTVEGSPLFVRQNARNRLVVATRYAPPVVALRAWSATIARALRLALGAPLGRGSSDTARAVRQGLVSALRALPRDLSTRRRWSRRTVLSPAARRSCISR
jgi:N-acetylglucosaminyl-diphospho-decaprenol L-rhamnosyltransferase